MDAFFIGFLVGILIFGAAASSWGFTALIPLFLIYVFLKKSKGMKLYEMNWKSETCSKSISMQSRLNQLLVRTLKPNSLTDVNLLCYEVRGT